MSASEFDGLADRLHECLIVAGSAAMIEFFLKLFGTDFMPHVFCLRTPGLIWLHALSDGVIAVAYFLIPLGLLRLLHNRRDLAFHWLFALFALFIFSCGATHVLGIITLWQPVYRLDGLIKLITALSSIATAIILIRLLPTIAKLPSPEQWRLANEELKLEIAQRGKAESSMRSLNSELERRVEERTRELEKKNHALQELTLAWDLSHGLIRDVSGTIQFWCKGNEQLYGWKKEEAVGKNSHQLLKTEFPRPLGEIEAELGERGSWSGELVHMTKSGSKLHLATHWVLQNPSSDSVSIIEVNNDVTDRLRAEEATRRLADIVESSIDAIIGSDVSGTIISWNSSAELLFGYNANEMIGKPVHSLVPEAIRAEEIKAFNEISRSKAARRYESIRLSRGGRMIDVAITISPIRSAAGLVLGTSMILHDITDTKAQEEAVRMSEERQRLAMEAGQVGLWYVDLRSGQSIWSQRCKELHGIRPEAEVAPYPFALRLIHPEDRDRVEADFKKIVDGYTNLSTEYRTRGLDSKMKWVQSRGNAHRDADGVVIAAHGTVIDLTARREMEDQLRRANTELEQFAYAAAHDLQEPLRNVALAAEILKTSPPDLPESHEPELLNIVIDNSRRMEAMVKDLLAYSRALDSSENTAQSTNVSLVLFEVLKNLSTAIEEKKASVTFDVLPSVCMQETHLLQILQNLVSNSLKYTLDREPRIHVGTRSAEDEIMLYVRDNGVGIAPQFHSRAFGMFKRLHSGSAQGTGIGLAVCKRIVEHYGGRIWIESQQGEGATFIFTVPCIEQAN